MPEEILRFEGLKLGGSKMRGDCIRKKRVYSLALGRYVMRCAEYDKGGIMGLGAFKIPGIDINQVKDTLITGAVAVGGAVATGKTIAYIGPHLKLDPASKWRPVIEIVTGIALGVLVGKATKKPDLGAALAIGPVVVNGLRLASGIMSTSVPMGQLRSPALSGARRQALGVIQDKAAFPPQYMYDNAFLSDAQNQVPVWAM